MVINVTYNTYSMDKIGLTYGAQVASIAYEMGMFEPSASTMDRHEQIVRDYTAWCLYFSIRQDYPSNSSDFKANRVASVQCYHLMAPSPIRHPPAAKLPDPDTNPEWYGEFVLQYPLNQTLIPMLYPQWTRFKYDLLCILRPVASELFDGEEKRSLEQRQCLFLRALSSLESLFSALPVSLSPAQVVFPLHMGVQ